MSIEIHWCEFLWSSLCLFHVLFAVQKENNNSQGLNLSTYML